MRPSLAPGRFVRWFVERIVVARDREFLLDDLDGEFRARRAAGRSATGWYLAQAVHAAVARRFVSWTARAENRGSSPMENTVAIGHYVRHAIRSLRVRPGITATAIAITALGIGSATAVSSAVFALLFKPLPLPQADRLVTGFSLREGFDPFGTSLLEYDAFRARTHCFASMGLARQQTSTLRIGTNTTRLQAAAVTADYLNTAGVTPARGRAITSLDDRPGAAAVALIGHALWERQFGGQQDVLGSTVFLDGRATTVVGVMPAGFDLPFASEVWIPMQIASDTLPLEQRLPGAYSLIARLRAGVSLQDANNEVGSIARALADEYPARRGWTYRVIGLRQQLVGDIDGRITRAIGILVAAVTFLLAICYVNVANLLLLRAMDGQRELAVRLALGASNRRLLNEQVAEYGLIGLAGGAAGALLATWLAPLLASLEPVSARSFATQLTDFRIHGVVLIVPALMAAVATAVFGFAPGAGIARRPSLALVLSATAPRLGVNKPQKRRLRVMVAAQIAVAVLLLIGGGLVLQSFAFLRSAELGFRPSGLATLQLTLPVDKYADHRRRAASIDAIVTGLRSIPAVTAAGVTTNIPLQHVSFDSFYTVEGRPQVAANDVPITAHRVVSPGYLSMLGVRLINGRLLSASDTADAPRVVVVTEELAKQAWPRQDAIGRHIRRGRAESTQFPWLTVVGVIGDVKEDRFNFRIDRAAWYLPYAQESSNVSPNVVWRSEVDPSTLVTAISDVIRRVDPDIGISALTTMDAHVAEVLTSERFVAVLLAALAAAGLALASLGLYGAISHIVLSQQREIALRVAVGAPRARVIGSVMREVAVVACAGVAAGGILASVGSTALDGILYRVEPYDPATYAAVAALIVVVSSLVAFDPVRRAASVDPAQMLR